MSAAIVTHTMRAKDGGTVTIEKLTKLRAIRAMCVECLGWEDDPKNCASPLCSLFPWRGRVQFSLKSDTDAHSVRRTSLESTISAPDVGMGAKIGIVEI